MGFWSSALAAEEQLRAQMHWEKENRDAGCLLFNDPENGGFRPNPGGQQQFFSLYPIQKATPETLPTHRWTALVSGIGFGKSMCGAVWLALMSEWFGAQEGNRAMILANSFPQLSQSTLVALVETCRKYNIPLEPYVDGVEENALAIANRRRCYIGENRLFVRVLSMNSFQKGNQSSRGQEVQFVWLDEGAFSGEQAFQVLDGRLRSSHGIFCRGLITSSPNGMNWLYNRFADPVRDESLKRNYHLITGSTKENVINVGESYYESLKSNYTDTLAQQELEGQFINVNIGLVFKAFKRSLHVLSGAEEKLLAFDPKIPLHLSFDFNYLPAIALYSQIRKNEIHFFKEEFMLDSDLWELMDKICDWIKPSGYLNYHREVFVYGDASGRQHSIHSKQTAWDIVFSRLRGIGLTPVRRFPDANPPVRNRINTANSLFKQERIFTTITGCPQLVKDFETVTWSGEGIDKNDHLRTHLGDAASYEMEYLFPFRPHEILKMGQKRIPGLAG